MKLSKNVWHVAFLLLVLSVSVATVVPVTEPLTPPPWWLRVDPEILSCGFPNCCLTFTVYVEGTSGNDPVHVAFEGGNLHWDERFTSVGMPAPFHFTVTHDCAPYACPYEITVWAWDNVTPPIPLPPVPPVIWFGRMRPRIRSCPPSKRCIGRPRPCCEGCEGNLRA